MFGSGAACDPFYFVFLISCFHKIWARQKAERKKKGRSLFKKLIFGLCLLGYVCFNFLDFRLKQQEHEIFLKNFLYKKYQLFCLIKNPLENKKIKNLFL